jgi:hypothetical protein
LSDLTGVDRDQVAAHRGARHHDAGAAIAGPLSEAEVEVRAEAIFVACADAHIFAGQALAQHAAVLARAGIPVIAGHAAERQPGTPERLVTDVHRAGIPIIARDRIRDAGPVLTRGHAVTGHGLDAELTFGSKRDAAGPRGRIAGRDLAWVLGRPAVYDDVVGDTGPFLAAHAGRAVIGDEGCAVLVGLALAGAALPDANAAHTSVAGRARVAVIANGAFVRGCADAADVRVARSDDARAVFGALHRAPTLAPALGARRPGDASIVGVARRASRNVSICAGPGLRVAGRDQAVSFHIIADHGTSRIGAAAVGETDHPRRAEISFAQSGAVGVVLTRALVGAAPTESRLTGLARGAGVAVIAWRAVAQGKGQAVALFHTEDHLAGPVVDVSAIGRGLAEGHLVVQIDRGRIYGRGDRPVRVEGRSTPRERQDRAQSRESSGHRMGGMDVHHSLPRR